MTDLNTPQKIQTLVELFYSKVQKDELLAPIFQNAKHFNWETHIPVIVDFWSTMLLQTNSYKGDMMGTHFELNEYIPLKPEHFKRWIELLQQTANENFAGEKTTELLSRANTIAQLMSFKLNGTV